MRKIFRVNEVFTPTSHAMVNFIERASVNNSLVKALQTPGTQVVVYGESGSGKSSLIKNKLNQIYEGHITTLCDSSMCFDQVILNAFDQIEPYYLVEKSSKHDVSINTSLSAQVLGIRSQIGASMSTSSNKTFKRFLPPQLTVQKLSQLLGVAKLCWVLEDFHKIPNDQKTRLSQSLKSFCDASSDYPDVKVIAIGAVDTARQVVEYDKELRNRVCEIRVDLMSEDELMEIINHGFELLKLKCSDRVAQQIVGFSSGLASVTHQFCMNICFEKEIVMSLDLRQQARKNESGKRFADITQEDLDAARSRYLEESADTLKSTFERLLIRSTSTKFDHNRAILRKLADGPQTGLTQSELLADMQDLKGFKDYTSTHLRRHLNNLANDDDGAVIYRSAAQRWRFVDPLHHVYAQAFLSGTSQNPRTKQIMTHEEHSIQKAMFDELLKLQSTAEHDALSSDLYSPDMEIDYIEYDEDSMN